MNAFTRMTLGWSLLEEVGSDGGAGGGGLQTTETAGDPQTSEGGVNETPPAPRDGADGEKKVEGSDKTEEKTEQTHRSAFAKFAEKSKTGSEKAEQNGPGDSNGETEKADNVPDLASMSDEDWAKAVQPTGEDGSEPDRSFMTAMAKVARENGVTPETMQKLAARFEEIEREKIAERDAALKKDQDEMAAKAEAAFDDSSMADIMAASSKFIKPDSMLAQAMRNTVLGSDIELLTILKNLGSTLRSDTPPTTAAAGSSQSADHRLFMRTVPERLR